MTLSQFTLPGTRSVGTPNPPGDMNQVVNAALASGAGFNVLSTVFDGGADPTGDTDSTGAFQAAMTAATGGQPIEVPPGTYTVDSASLEPIAGTVGALIGSGGSAGGGEGTTVINFNLSTAGISFGSNTGYQQYVIRDMTLNQNGSGDVLACGTGTNERFPQLRCENVAFNANNEGGACLNAQGSASMLADSKFTRCAFGSDSATRTLNLIILTSTLAGGISNCTWDNCDFNPADNDEFCVYIAALTAPASADNNYHSGMVFRDCRFEHPWGGAVKSISGRGLVIENATFWDLSVDSPGMGNSLIYIGSTANQLVSEGTKIIGCLRDLSGPDGSSTWDIYLESTVAQTLIDSYGTMPGYHTTADPAYFNFNGCHSVTIINPQDDTATDATQYVITNPPSLTSNLIQPGILPASWQPSDSSYLAWNFDPAAIGNATSPASAQAQFLRIQVRQAIPVTNIVLFMRNPGSNLSDSFVALVSGATGDTVGVSTDQSTAWEDESPSTNVVTALSGGPYTIQPGDYYATFVSTTTGGSVPTFGQWNNYNAIATNAAGSGVLTNATARWATLGTVSSLAGPFTLSSNTRSQVQYWGALS